MDTAQLLSQVHQRRTFLPGQVEAILLEIGVDVVSEMDSDLSVFCPFHHNVRTPAGEISKDSGIFYCFSCHHTCKLEDFIEKSSDLSAIQAVRLIKRYSSKDDISLVINETLKAKVEYEEFDQSLVDRLHDDCVFSDKAMNWWKSRGITKHTVNEFKLGFSEKQNMSITPVHSPKGMLLGFVGRTISGEKRFKNSNGLKKSRTLFNLHREKIAPEIVVVESSIDAMILHQIGIPAVATLGATISKTQVELLKSHFPYVIIIPDNDDAGRLMTKRLSDIFGNSLTVLGLPANIKDVGELDEDQLKRLKAKINDPLGLTI